MAGSSSGRGLAWPLVVEEVEPSRLEALLRERDGAGEGSADGDDDEVGWIVQAELPAAMTYIKSWRLTRVSWWLQGVREVKRTIRLKPCAAFKGKDSVGRTKVRGGKRMQQPPTATQYACCSL